MVDASAGSTNSLDSHGISGAHSAPAAEGQTTPQTKHRSTPKLAAPAGNTTTAAAKREATPILVPPLPSQPPRETKLVSIPSDEASLAGRNLPDGQPTNDTQESDAAGDHEQGPHASAIAVATPRHLSLGLADPLLALAADVLDDLESVRTANENRLRQLTRDVADKDGEERGFGLTEDHPDVARLAALVGALKQAEDQAAKNLTKRLKDHPLAPWLKAQRGVGDKQAARLLAAIGDPYWNTLHDRPRTVSELWAYCGYHVLPAGQREDGTQSCVASGSNTSHPDHTAGDTQRLAVGVAPKRARGAKANWSATAKMRVYLVAESCMKQLRKPCEKDPDLGYAIHTDDCQCSPFRLVYDETRAKYADATHRVECVRCGPKGKPAQPGTPLSDAHKMARALRAVSKQLLKELWREARRLHTGETDDPHERGPRRWHGEGLEGPASDSTEKGTQAQ